MSEAERGLVEIVESSLTVVTNGVVGQLVEAEAEAGVLPRLRSVVAAQPNAVAVADAHRRVTYAELAAGAALVRQLVLTDGEVGEPIAVLHRHDAGAVVVALGVLASGRPLIMLDPRTPVPRLAELAARAGARSCLADGELLDAAGAVAPRALAVPAVPQGSAVSRAATAVAAMWAAPPRPASPAVLAFTSGTTGRPKIVVNDHRMLVHDAWSNAIATGAFGAGDVVGHTLPMAFHAGLMAVVAGTLVGARLELYDVRSSGIGGLARWLHDVDARFTALSPAISRALVSTAPDPAHLASLRAVSLAGEAVHGVDVRRLQTLLDPACVLLSRYGSSETGLMSTHTVRAGDEVPDGPLPVGPVAGMGRLTVCGEDGEPVPDGEAGVVAITRCHLASGYFDDAEATAAAFTEHPDGTSTFRSNDVGRLVDGQLTLLGRRDHSVKIRGYLVEPGEVDAALFALPDVREAVTVGVPQEEGTGYRLIAYVVPAAEKPSAAGIRTGLRKVLPGHMVPATVVFLDALPRTERGKIDRAALPPPPPAITGQGPLTVWEGALAEAWCTVLELEDIPRDADFFELGGDSLAAEAVISIVTTQLGVPAEGVTPALLAEAPTIAEFAKRLHRRPDREHPTLTTLRAEGSRPPLWLMAGGGALGVGFVPLARRLDPEQPVHALHAHGLERRAIPDWTVESMARRHLGTLRAVQPKGPYFLAGHSFGGILAFEMAQQLRSHGHEVGLLMVLDSFPPDPALLPPPPNRSLVGRVKGVVGLALTGLVPTPGVGQYWRFHTQSQFLSRRYSSGPYAGPTLVLVAESDESATSVQWGRYLTGPWRMHTVAGNHYSFLRDPFVSTTAALISTALEEARERTFSGTAG